MNWDDSKNPQKWLNCGIKLIKLLHKKWKLQMTILLTFGSVVLSLAVMNPRVCVCVCVCVRVC